MTKVTAKHARKYNTNRYTERIVEETMKKLPMDVAWVLQSIISATSTEDVENVVDAFVTGVKCVTERGISNVSREIESENQTNEVNMSGDTQGIAVKDSPKVVESTDKESSKDSNADSSGICGSVSADRSSTHSKKDIRDRKGITIEPIVGADAIVAGMTGAPELNNIKRSILNFENTALDTSDVYAILNLKISQMDRVTLESIRKVFRNASDLVKLQSVIERYNEMIKEKLSGVSFEPEYNVPFLAFVSEYARDKESEQTEYKPTNSKILLNSTVSSYYDYINNLSECAKEYNFSDCIIYSTGTALKLKGIVKDSGNVVVMTLRFLLGNYDEEYIAHKKASTLHKITYGIKVPKIVDALR